MKVTGHIVTRYLLLVDLHLSGTVPRRANDKTPLNVREPVAGYATRVGQRLSRLAGRRRGHDAVPALVIVVDRIARARPLRQAPAPARVEGDVFECDVIVARQTRVVMNKPVRTWKRSLCISGCSEITH